MKALIYLPEIQNPSVLSLVLTIQDARSQATRVKENRKNIFFALFFNIVIVPMTCAKERYVAH